MLEELLPGLDCNRVHLNLRVVVSERRVARQRCGEHGEATVGRDRVRLTFGTDKKGAVSQLGSGRLRGLQPERLDAGGGDGEDGEHGDGEDDAGGRGAEGCGDVGGPVRKACCRRYLYCYKDSLSLDIVRFCSVAACVMSSNFLNVSWNAFVVHRESSDQNVREFWHSYR